MDKFGIFKLLTGLLANKESETAENATENSAEPSHGNSQTSWESFSSSGNSRNSLRPATKPTDGTKPPNPLKAELFSTINSHDEFLKRVYKNNAKIPAPHDGK